MFKTQTIITRLLDAVIMNGADSYRQPELRLAESSGGKRSM